MADARTSLRSTLGATVARGAILQAATAVFARSGYAATRVEDILEEAGIARRTFYRHFSNKDEVLAAIYEIATTELIAAIRASVAASPDSLEAILAALDAYLDYHVANARLLEILELQAMRSDSLLAPIRQRFRDDLAEILDRAARARTGVQHDPLIYIALISALEGTSLHLLANGATKKEAARAKKAMRFLLERAIAEE